MIDLDGIERQRPAHLTAGEYLPLIQRLREEIKQNTSLVLEDHRLRQLILDSDNRLREAEVKLERTMKVREAAAILFETAEIPVRANPFDRLGPAKVSASGME